MGKLISDLDDGGDAQGTDLVEVERDGPSSFKVPLSAVVDLAIEAIETALYAPGDIKITLDSVPQSGWLELDGSTISGGVALYPGIAARYPWMVSGSDLKLPDARGRFLRSYAHGSANDPDRASRTARAGDGATGDNPGTYQADGAPNITGTVNQPNNWASFSAGGSGALSAVSNGAAPGQPIGSGSIVGRINLDASASNAKYGAGTDVRPINMAVMYQMKAG